MTIEIIGIANTDIARIRINRSDQLKPSSLFPTSEELIEMRDIDSFFPSLLNGYIKEKRTEANVLMPMANNILPLIDFSGENKK